MSLRKWISAATLLAMVVGVTVAGSEKPSFPPGSQGGMWTAGPDDTILMSYSLGKARGGLAGSTDTGVTWEILSTFEYAGGSITLTSDGWLVMVVSDDQQRIGWICSRDRGRSWSAFTPISVEWKFRVHPWGPIYEASDGRWAYTPYAQNNHLDADALMVWSNDQGRTWSQPIAFPTPTDGNLGLTEAALLEYRKGRFLAAIRSDDVKNGGFDGFYFSRSEDGRHWSQPRPLGDMGRQPHFYRIGETFVLSYRQYAPWDDTGYATVRFSRDGTTWSRPFRIRKGVQDGPNIIGCNGLVIAFNQLYPEAAVRTRQVIRIPDPAQWFLSELVRPFYMESERD